MEKEKIEQRISEIDKEMDDIREDAKKGKRIAMVAVPTAIAVGGTKIAFESIDPFFKDGNWILGLILLTIGLSIAISAALFAILNIKPLVDTVEISRRYNSLEKEKADLLKQKDENLQVEEEPEEVVVEEQNEDVLLQLLADGKITVEEYKKYSKK